jgi:aerobic-type carbon monoxide dehydrogenase small subunit (CoxS/CutS family)
VSNLSFVSKVLEKVVDSQLRTYLSHHNLLEPFQSAYRKGHSTETALIRVQNDILCSLGNQHVVLLVLLDLSAAFDTVDHRHLLSILEELGIQGSALQWFASYLLNRSQIVNIDGAKSEPKLLNCGVPQGSVLGPTLFTIYTTSLGHLLRQHGISYHLYADDTQLYLTCKPEEVDCAVEKLEDIIASVQSWMCKHHLKLNSDKTEFLVISSKPVSKKLKPVHMNINSHIIEPTSMARNIGVIMDSHMSMESHVSSICKAAYFHIRNISRLKKYLDKDSLETIIHAFISSKLDYCNSLLCGISAAQLSRLQRIQNVAARILTGTPKSDHITPVLSSLHWLPIDQRIKFKIITLVHKAPSTQNTTIW